jgi:hypothetical protein
MKRLMPILVISGILVAGLAVYWGVHYTADHYLDKRPALEQPLTADCTTPGRTYRATIQNGIIRPQETRARLCDQLVVTNLDKTVREIAFGKHDHHQVYDGTLERTLAQNDSLTIRLNQTGNYRYHDHFHDEVAATFSVSR